MDRGISIVVGFIVLLSFSPMAFPEDEAIKLCYSRSSGDDKSEMIIKAGKARSGKLAYSCYIPLKSIKSNSDTIKFKNACKNFVKEYLNCADFDEETMNSLKKQFKREPKVLKVKLDGVVSLAVELNR